VSEKFFEGNNYFGDYHELGHIWIANHGQRKVSTEEFILILKKCNEHNIKPPQRHAQDKDGNWIIDDFQTLTYEPIVDRSQYEIAVRIFSDGKWRGYQVAEYKSMFLAGRGTHGH